MIAVTPLAWIREPDENKTGILSTYVEGPEEMIPLPVLTKGISKEEIDIGGKQFLDIVFCGGNIIGVYADAEEFSRVNTATPPESVRVTVRDAEANSSAARLSAIVTGKVKEIHRRRPDPEDSRFTYMVITVEILGSDYTAKLRRWGALPEVGNTVFILGACPAAKGVR